MECLFKLAVQGLGEESVVIVLLVLGHGKDWIPIPRISAAVWGKSPWRQITWSMYKGSRLCVRSLTEDHESLSGLFGPAISPVWHPYSQGNGCNSWLEQSPLPPHGVW